jgi:hypothetical protein
MRFINVLIFLAVIFGAVWLYIYVEEFAKWIGILDFRVTFDSTWELLIKSIIPHVLIIYLVLAVAGAALCYFVDSSVPLKWCLALGFSCALANLLAFSSPSMRWVLINTSISLGMLVAPVLGGYQIKRRAWRIPRRPRN